MQIEIYYSNNFVNETSEIFKIKEKELDKYVKINGKLVPASTTTTAKKMYKSGWKLSNVIKTGYRSMKSSGDEDHNFPFPFLLIFEK